MAMICHTFHPTCTVTKPNRNIPGKTYHQIVWNECTGVDVILFEELVESTHLLYI